MPTPISSGTPDPRNFIDDPGDTSYKWGGPGSPGRGSNLGPAGLSLGAGGGGYGPGGGGAVAFGTNPFMRRKLRMGPTAGAGQMQYGGPGVDPSQFQTQMLGGVGGQQPWQGGGAPMGVKAGAMPQANRGGWRGAMDNIQRIRDTMQQYPGWQPGQPAPQGPQGPQGTSMEDTYGRIGRGQANQHDVLNFISQIIGGGTIPGSIADPRGTAASQEARRQASDRTRVALQRRGKLAAQARGGLLDDSQRGFADFFSDLGINQGLGQANQEADNAQAMAYDQWVRDLLGQSAAYNYGRGSAEQNSLLAHRYQPKQPSGIPGMIGQIGGAALGGWLGGLGGGGGGGYTTNMPVNPGNGGYADRRPWGWQP